MTRTIEQWNTGNATCGKHAIWAVMDSQSRESEENKAEGLVDMITEGRLYFLPLGGHAEEEILQGREPTAIHTSGQS